jgi:hypothetical protein
MGRHRHGQRDREKDKEREKDMQRDRGCKTNTEKQRQTQKHVAVRKKQVQGHIQRKEGQYETPAPRNIPTLRHSLTDTFTHHRSPYLSFLALAQCLKGGVGRELK